MSANTPFNHSEDYLSWEDLLEETPAASQSAKVDAAPISGAEKPAEHHMPAGHGDDPGSNVSGDQMPLALDDILSDAKVPGELRQVLEERKQLESQMDQLLGKADADPEEARRQACFPVKIHTRETRIEEKRQQKRQQQQHAAKTRELAKKTADRKLLAARQQEQLDAKARELAKRSIERKLLAEREQEQKRIAEAMIIKQKQTAELEKQRQLQARALRLKKKLADEREQLSRMQRLKLVQEKKAAELELLAHQEKQRKVAANKRLAERIEQKWHAQRFEQQVQIKRENHKQQVILEKLQQKRDEAREAARKAKAVEQVKAKRKEAAELEKRFS